MTDTARDLATNDHEQTRRCTDGGVAHDFRPHHYLWCNMPWTSWRCVWCHGVACGNYGSHDPCWRIYHHDDPHRSRAGLEWPLGGTRPDVELADR